MIFALGTSGILPAHGASHKIILLRPTCILGYFYWEIIAGKLGLRAGCEAWKNAENPAERFLKAYGEKEGSTIRKLVEVLRDPDVELTQFASEIETHFPAPQDHDELEYVNETPV